MLPLVFPLYFYFCIGGLRVDPQKPHRLSPRLTAGLLSACKTLFRENEQLEFNVGSIVSVYPRKIPSFFVSSLKAGMVPFFVTSDRRGAQQA